MGRTYKEAITKFPEMSPVGQSSFNNILTGGQAGLGNNLRYLDAATPLVQPNAIPVVVHIPTMFEAVDNMGKMLKAIVERHTKSIDGVNYTLSLETAEGLPFKDSQTLEVATRAVVAPITPTMTFTEYGGNPIHEFHRRWIEMKIHPDTQFSSLSSFTGFGNDGEYAPFLVSSYSMATIFIQPDLTLLPQNILSAALVINMFPKEIGDKTYKKDISSGADVIERSITYTGIIIDNAATRAIGIEIAKKLNLHTANYNYAPAPMDDDYNNTIELESGHTELMDDIENYFVDPNA